MTILKSISRWALSKQCFAVLFSLLILPVRGSFALDYVIKEVIEVGEADFVPFLGPLKWSPDGSKLAFFKNGVLKTSDTLGVVSEVTKVDVLPHRYDWVTNEKLAFDLITYPGPGINTDEKLIVLDLPSRQKRSIHEFKTSPGYRRIPGKTTASGPYRTIERNNFYLFTTYSAEGGKTIVERRSFLDDKAETLKDNHILRWGYDGLYMVNLDGTDSTWLAKKPFEQMGPKQAISSDLSFAMDGGQVFNLKDSSLIVLDTLLGPPPPKTVECGVNWFSFNPAANEIAFTITCDDGENYMVSSIATFDCETTKLTKLDSLIGLQNCVSPEFSPNGQRIAFFSNGKAYILNRQIK